ncbi:GPI mannosyltransferase 2 [Mycotypha africana]|uniref:GPI mannosyltransferase 2 n=1 Tax=Mycotypha africana TaxID=64632 RepID=UPI00230115A0|nr:GPI mannosyltransferase 2 [Mycotypha africana]KAI8967814.1 GPI mannosyltransferase 2 [Mycotypha africana]
MLAEIHKVAAITRLITIGLAIASYIFIGSYDSSAEIQLDSSRPHVLNVFLRWDAMYFLHISEFGYIFEQETAFFPLMPLIARFIANTVFWPLQSILSYRYTLLLAGVTIANVCFVLAAGALYRLTIALLPGNKKLAFASAIAFCLSPPAMFMSSFYTESLFAWITFEGMRFIAQKKYLLAALIWSFASAARSNAIVYSGFFFYDLFWMRFVNRKRYLTGLVKACIYTLITISGFVAFQYYTFNRFCSLDRPWCENKLPLLYSFVQKEYWGNGFLAYYEVKQIPNFVLAAPIILISLFGLKNYIQHDSLRFLTIHLMSSKTPYRKADENQSYTSSALAVYMYLWAFLLVFVCCNMHVQVIIRFFTSLPPLYWFVGALWSKAFGSSQLDKNVQSTVAANLVFSYFILYGLAGIVLFSGFLPPA